MAGGGEREEGCPSVLGPMGAERDARFRETWGTRGWGVYGAVVPHLHRFVFL